MRDFRAPIPNRGPMILYRITLAVAVTVCLVLAVSASAKEPRSASVKREFHLTHPCPATWRTSVACPGYDHIVPARLRRAGRTFKHAVADDPRREGKG